MNKKMISAIFGQQYIPLFEKRSNKKRVFCHNDIMDLITRVETRKFDMSSLLGDTIKEKYESLYVKLCESTIELGKSGNYYPDIIVADKYTSSLFECACSGWVYYDKNEEIVRIKNIHNRWDLYRDSSLPHDTILLTNKNLVRGIVIETNFSKLYPHK
jgi:hypothetical protein